MQTNKLFFQPRRVVWENPPLKPETPPPIVEKGPETPKTPEGIMDESKKERKKIVPGENLTYVTTKGHSRPEGLNDQMNKAFDDAQEVQQQNPDSTVILALQDINGRELLQYPSVQGKLRLLGLEAKTAYPDQLHALGEIKAGSVVILTHKGKFQVRNYADSTTPGAEGKLLAFVEPKVEPTTMFAQDLKVVPPAKSGEETMMGTPIAELTKRPEVPASTPAELDAATKKALEHPGSVVFTGPVEIKDSVTTASAWGMVDAKGNVHFMNKNAEQTTTLGQIMPGGKKHEVILVNGKAAYYNPKTKEYHYAAKNGELESKRAIVREGYAINRPEDQTVYFANGKPRQVQEYQYETETITGNPRTPGITTAGTEGQPVLKE